MNNVFLVKEQINDEFSNYETYYDYIAIFSTKEKAQEFIDKSKSLNYSIFEEEVDMDIDNYFKEIDNNIKKYLENVSTIKSDFVNINREDTPFISILEKQKTEIVMFCPVCEEIIQDEDIVTNTTFSGCRTTLTGDLEPEEIEYKCPNCYNILEEREKDIDNEDN